jgi:hypothetical protein
MRVCVTLEQGKDNKPFAVFSMPVIGMTERQLISWATQGIDGLAEHMGMIECAQTEYRVASQARVKGSTFDVKFSYVLDESGARQTIYAGRNLTAEEAAALQAFWKTNGLDTEIA